MIAELRRLAWDLMKAGKFPVISIAAETRTQEQNRLMWPILTDVSNQVEWPTGSKILRSPEDWKTIFMSALNTDQTNLVLGLNSEVINLNLKTSNLSKARFSELIEFIYAEGTERGTRWTDPAINAYEEITEAR